MGNRRERRTSIGGQFAARLIEMIESPAFRVLSLSARRILDRVEIEFAHHGGTDNGRLPVTYDDFVAYGIHRHAIGPAIREAEALGFLQVTERGRAGNADFRSPNRFRITYRHAKNIQGDGSHEWRKIETIERALQIAAEARKGSGSKVGKQGDKKQKSSGGKRQISVTESGTESAKPPVAETTTTAMVRNPSLLSISPGEPGPTLRSVAKGTT